MAAATICNDFGAQKNKVWHCFHCFPIYLPWSDGTECPDLSFLNIELKPTFSLSSFTFIKRLFSFSSLCAIRVVSSVYLRLLIFLLAILIPACVSSSPEFLMMYSAYKLNKQGDNIQPWRTPFPIWNQLKQLSSSSSCCSMSSSNCCFLTCTRVSQEGKVVWYSHLFQSFPQFIVIHTVKGFGIVNIAEIDVFLELSCLLQYKSSITWKSLWNKKWECQYPIWFVQCWIGMHTQLIFAIQQKKILFQFCFV